VEHTIEAIKPIFAVFTLTAVGIKTRNLNPDEAQELAQKVVDSHKPGFNGQSFKNAIVISQSSR
jgi:hypothetical protein